MWQTLLNDHSLYALFPLHWLVIAIIIALLYQKYIIRSSLYSANNYQIWYFHIALMLFVLLRATPLEIIGDYYLFSAHTLQLFLIYFLVVPLLILSLPKDFLRQHIWHHQTRFLVKLLSHPWLSLITFNGLISIYYIPTVFKVVQAYWVLAVLVRALLFFNAFFMWWVIIKPVPEIKGLDFLMQTLYIFLASAILMPIGFFYIIVLKAHFPVYIAQEGQIIPFLTAIYDQQLAGGLLKFIQIFSYAYALLIIFFKWGKQEQDIEGKVQEENIRYARGVVIHLDEHRRKNKDKKKR